MSSTRNPGRVAGLWYLLLCVLGPLRLIYIPSKLFVHGNATATADNIAAHQWLFRFGIVADLVGAVILIVMTLAFYRLFKGVDQHLAVLVVILGGVMPALLYLVNVASDAATLTLVFMSAQTLLPAIQRGEVTVATIDEKVRHILRKAIEFGFYDREQTDTSIPLYSQEGRKIALEAARAPRAR